MSRTPIPYIATICNIKILVLYGLKADECISTVEKPQSINNSISVEKPQSINSSINPYVLVSFTVFWLEFLRYIGNILDCCIKTSVMRENWQEKLAHYAISRKHQHEAEITEITQIDCGCEELKIREEFIRTPAHWIEELELQDLQRFLQDSQETHANRLTTSRSKRELITCDLCHMPCESWDHIAVNTHHPHNICDARHQKEMESYRNSKALDAKIANDWIYPFAISPKEIDKKVAIKPQAHSHELLEIAVSRFGPINLKLPGNLDSQGLKGQVKQFKAKLTDKIMPLSRYKTLLKKANEIGLENWNWDLSIFTVAAKIVHCQLLPFPWLATMQSVIKLGTIFFLALMPIVTVQCYSHRKDSACEHLPMIPSLVLALICQMLWARFTYSKPYFDERIQKQAATAKVHDAIMEYLGRPSIIKSNFEDLLYQILALRPKLIESFLIAERLDLICPVTFARLVEKKKIALLNTNYVKPYHTSCIDQLLKGRVGFLGNRPAKCPLTQQPIRAVIYPFRTGKQFISILDSSLNGAEIARIKEQGLAYRDSLTAEIKREAERMAAQV